MSGFDDVDSIMAELGLGGSAPAPKKAAPVRESAPSHYSTVPNKQAIRTDDVDDIMAELGLGGDTRSAPSQYGNVPLAPKSNPASRQPPQQAQNFSGNMYKQVPKASAAESEVDDLLADLGLGDSSNEPGGYSGARGSAVGAPGGYSTGPGRGGARGGGVSSGPGGARGRGGVSSGPGGARGRGAGVSSGPGNRGGMSSGPGGGRGGRGGGGVGGGGASSGPGRIGPLATHTADGREIQFSGPPCAACEETIIGAVTNALEKQYHPDCFACVSCQTPFGEGEFLVHEGQPFCDACFNELFAVRCVTCSQPVTGRCIEVGDKKYHPEHFCCSSCGTPLAGKPYKEDDGDVFCAACKAARQRRVAKENGICGQCKQPIIGEYIMLRGQRMHPKHFRCEECGCAFSGGNCHEYEGKLYCKEDYLKLLKDICSFCHKPIIGRSFTALGRVWHPEHFVCNHCVPEDHEILTNRGFLSLDQYVALSARDDGLLVASYDTVAAAMTFELPQQLVVKPAETQQLVELTSVHEMLDTWSPTSDAYGVVSADNTSKKTFANKVSNHVSLLVTPDHHIYGQYGNSIVASDGELTMSTERPPAAKLRASAIAEAQIAKRGGVCATAVRQVAAAVNGVKGASEALPPFAAELGLTNEADFVAFASLYGFWLGDGTISRKHVAFHQVKEEDVAFLRSTFEQLQVEFSISDTSPYQILVFNESWSNFFLAEYGHLYGAEGEVDVEADVEGVVAGDAAAADDDDGDERMDDLVGEPSQSSLAFVTKFVSSTIDADVRKNGVLRTAAMYERSLATAVPLVAPPSRELPTPGVGARGAYDLFSSAAGSYMAPEGIQSAKWFASWVWSLPPKWIRVIVEGLRRADGACAVENDCKPSLTIYTSSVRFRDEIQRLCLLAGCTSHFVCHYERGTVLRAATCNSAAIVARHDSWAVSYVYADSKMGSSQRSAAPVLHKARGEIRERQYTGRVWCFTMPSGFIWVRRVGVDERGVVTKASRPLLTGNCKEPLGTASYMEKDGQPYCELHWHALFGSVCARCDKAIMGGVIRAVGKNFHQACFTCSGCDGQMTDGHYEWETKAMCKKCFMKLPADVRKRIETKRKEQLKAEKSREKATS